MRTWEKLKIALRTRRKGLQSDTWRTPPKETPPKPTEYSFIIGKRYIIENSRAGKLIRETCPSSGNLCVFRYEGKSGIHHVFREARGGWSRTYTDAQLIGKKIEEANHG